MCRRYKLEDWLCYESGDYSAQRKTAMREHASNCADCAALSSEAQQTFTLAQFHATSDASDILRERTWSAFRAASLAKPARSIPLWRPWLAAGAITAAAAGVLLAPALLPSHPAPVAFAQVEQAMAEIHTATWREIQTSTLHVTRRINGKPQSPHTATIVTRHWATLDPPRTASQIDSGSDSQEGTWQTVSDGIYSISVRSNKNEPQNPPTYYRSEYSAREHAEATSSPSTPRDRIVRDLLFPRDPIQQGAQEYQENYSSGNDVSVHRTPWVSHTDTLEGKPVLRFESRMIRTFTVTVPKPGRIQMQSSLKVWVDPDTYRVVRREEFSLPETGNVYQWRRVSEGFHYNEELPTSVFTLPRPPVGVWFEYNDSTRESEGVRRTSETDEREMERLIAHAVATWNRKDTRTFLSLWDFEHSARMGQVYHGTPVDDAEIAERRRHWTARMQKGIPYQTWHITAIRNLGWGLGASLLRLQSEDETFPPASPPRPDRYMADVDATAVLKPGAASTPVHATFTLVRNDAGQFRISYINMYERPLTRRIKSR